MRHPCHMERHFLHMGGEKMSTPKLGKPALSDRAAFVQIERKAHADWGKLAMKSPAAASLMHHLVHLMDKQNAVVVSQKTLASLVGCTRATIVRAVELLRDQRWIDVVKLHGPGQCAAYVVNSEVAWCDTRDNKRLALFTARVVADAEDQDADAPTTPLRRVPIVFPPEEAIPSGELLPGDQDSLPGMEPVIVGPSRQIDIEEYTKLESKNADH